ncbi:MAG: hypothetical protein A3D35_02205 [Candidatus Staskawiczbacteria bacterium RIFCSPHIGHO2_02_FULL_34_9]|uniref:Methyltransferase domain-containing protein n=1 Tax=Candidatus Staskawiczbacteria bacterium RIFCSPHIGHO2_02_FULL_34_9 TaxID=1802206 RepID=A0A1G2I177_9BACT|nr:MAG: hypothetical protein A3D35_02205 [Candidatus Staskawiczbacteria bacterium RIFCSPHIGHO2_02_FULL_34_9]
MNIKDTYNKIAEAWHKDHNTDDWWVSGTNKFLELISPGSIILDVGCGGGTKSQYLIDKGMKVVGIDIAENMVQIAKREVPKGEFMAMDLLDVDKISHDFDGIFMQAVLLHIPKKDVMEILQKMVNKLKSKGLLYVSVKEKRPGGVDEEKKIDDDYGYEYERFFSYFTIDELNQDLESLGLEVIFTENNPPSRTARASNWISIIGQKK